MRSLLRHTLRRTFSTAPNPGQKKNIFKLPLKQDFKPECIDQVDSYINSADSCSILAATFKDNIQLFTDGHLLRLYTHLRNYELEIDNTFHTIISPISLQYLKVFNRQQAIVMYQMLMTVLHLKIDNQPLYNSLINKLDTQNCYRYIPLYETAMLLEKLLENEQTRGIPLTRKLITVVYQQKEFYKQPACRPVIQGILSKIGDFKGDEPLLTEAYKQLK